MTLWTAAVAFRDRREQLGLAQADVAKSLNISKSLLSRIESGERQPTEEQIEGLAELLCMPSDLLALASGRLPEDIREALIANAAETVAAVRQRVEAQAVVYPRTPQKTPLPKAAVILQKSTALLISTES
jgi:transcriptional regulator with XRE-family HTH domain